VTQLTVSYNARTVSTVEELQQVYQQTTRSRQKNRTSPSGKKARASEAIPYGNRPLHARSLLFFQIELKHIR
jgi:hypothetical protein